MRWAILLLALLCLGCTTEKNAYLNATEAYDSDFRGMVKLLERWPQERDLDWQMVERQSAKSLDRLREAHKTFAQGPAGSESMRSAASDLIVKLVPPLHSVHELSVKAVGKTMTAEQREQLAPMTNTAKLALELYDARRKEFRGG